MKLLRLGVSELFGPKLLSVASGLLLTNSFIKLGSFIPEAVCFMGISYTIHALLTLKIGKK